MWKQGVTPGGYTRFPVYGTVDRSRCFYTPFITFAPAIYFYTCPGALCTMTVHNPHVLSTDLSTIHHPFPPAAGRSWLCRSAEVGHSEVMHRFVDRVYNSQRARLYHGAYPCGLHRARMNSYTRARQQRISIWDPLGPQAVSCR